MYTMHTFTKHLWHINKKTMHTPHKQILNILQYTHTRTRTHTILISFKGFNHYCLNDSITRVCKYTTNRAIQEWMSNC